VSLPVDLQALSEPLREQLVERHQAREVALQAAREATRSAANAIRAIHRGDGAAADELVAASRSALDVAVEACEGHPEVLHAGFVQDAAKEHAEAALTRAAVVGEQLPAAEEVGVDGVSWLHGLAETVGELRRASLDRVRLGDVAGAESLLELMQEILATLATIDVPDGLSRGLRRATDAARAITERTRGDLTAAAGQRELRAALDAHREALERSFDAGRDGRPT
jgi:translin